MSFFSSLTFPTRPPRKENQLRRLWKMIRVLDYQPRTTSEIPTLNEETKNSSSLHLSQHINFHFCRFSLQQERFLSRRNTMNESFSSESFWRLPSCYWSTSQSTKDYFSGFNLISSLIQNVFSFVLSSFHLITKIGCN